MRTLLLLLLSLLLLLGTASWGAEAETGEWMPVKDVGDPYVKEIAQYAVSQHNAEANTSLSLVRVVSGEWQVVAGSNYLLFVEAKEAAGVARYEALVYDRPWEHFRELDYFNPA